MNANALKYLLISLQYLPHVLAGVQAVELAVGSSASGSSKKTLVLAAIGAATKVGENVPEAHVQIISTLIDSVVSVLNSDGAFKHAAGPVPVPTAPTATVLEVTAAAVVAPAKV